ncbi:MAG TPA: cytochrome c [Candidatus Binatia bacterium]|nr:cytochrome c [Candidatus Binatia bacterium]
MTWLASSGCSGGDRDLPAIYRRLPVPAARLASPAARRRGAALFAEHCALCHGERGDGRGVRHEGLSTAPRDFTDPAWQQRTSPRRAFFAIREGVPGTAMPSWRALDDAQTWDLVARVLSFGGPRS